MIRGSWRISRRTLLRGAGAAIALPLLEAMLPSTLFGGEPKVVPRKTPIRFAALYMPNGVDPRNWTPKQPGPLAELPALLAPLEKLKADTLVISGLTNKASYPNDGHYAKGAAFLTGTTITKTTGADINVGGVSMDQLLAQYVGQYTRLPSIELGLEKPFSSVDAGVGLTTLYGCHVSWSAPTTPVAREIDPRQAFDRIFRGQGDEDPAKAKRSTALNPWDDRSVIDFVQEDAAALKGRVGVADQRKLDEYLTTVRDVEKRIQAEMKHAQEPHRVDRAALEEMAALGQRAKAAGGRNHAEQAKLMLDLIVLAFWTDSTRIATLMFGNEVSGQNFSFLDGVKGGHHELSHHENKEEKLEQYKRIGVWHVQQVAYLLERLKAIKEGKDTLLDNSMILFGSGIRDGNAHDPHDLPILLAGRGGGTLKPGRHIACPRDTPLTNLYGDVMARMGLQVDQFADSTGPIRDLNA